MGGHMIYMITSSTEDVTCPRRGRGQRVLILFLFKFLLRTGENQLYVLF
jgi:hypothetical protein